MKGETEKMFAALNMNGANLMAAEVRKNKFSRSALFLLSWLLFYYTNMTKILVFSLFLVIKEQATVKQAIF